MTVANDELLTLKEAANYLRVDPQTLRRAVKQRKIEVIRVGNHPKPDRRPMRFTLECLQRYISTASN